MPLGEDDRRAKQVGDRAVGAAEGADRQNLRLLPEAARRFEPRRVERGAVIAADRQILERLPGDADLGIGGAADVAVIVVAYRPRQGQAAQPRHAVGGAEYRHDQFAEQRLHVARRIGAGDAGRRNGRAARAGDQRLLQIVVMIFGAHREADVAAADREQWSFGDEAPFDQFLHAGVVIFEIVDRGEHGGVARARVIGIERGCERRAREGGGDGGGVDQILVDFAVAAAEIAERAELPAAADIDVQPGGDSRRLEILPGDVAGSKDVGKGEGNVM